MLLQETSSVPLDSPKSWEFDNDLLSQIQALPRRSDITLRFVDLDGTLLDDRKRFEKYPALQNHRWDKAYDYIKSELFPWIKDEYQVFKRFLESLEPRELLLTWRELFYDPNSVHDIIITAWNKVFQLLKIQLSEIQLTKERIILTDNAHEKPEEMLRYILSIGYIPWKIEFYDDRIEDNFVGAEDILAEILDIRVEFYQAIQGKKSVKAVKTRVGRAMEMMMG